MINSSTPHNTQVRSAVQVDVGRKVADVDDLPERRHEGVETGVLTIPRPIASPR